MDDEQSNPKVAAQAALPFGCGKPSEITVVYEYTLAEWIEMNRAWLPRRSRVLLRLAEMSALPLVLLSGIALAALVLRLFTPVVRLGVGYLALSLLTFIVLMRVRTAYISKLAVYRKRYLTNQWRFIVAGKREHLRATEDGIEFLAAAPPVRQPWSHYTSGFETAHLLLLSSEDSTFLGIPIRAFDSEEEYLKFSWLSYRKIVSEKDTTGASPSDQ